MDSMDRDRLLLRASYRCEYCRTVLLGALWEEEHILPRVKGGSDSLENLAVACPRCNRNKKDKDVGVDFVTGNSVRLYDPRTDRWEEHFGVIAGQVVGKSEIGRATATLLFKQTAKQVPRDLHWWPLQNLQSEALYGFLNQQRARRLSNRYSELEKGLSIVGEVDRSAADHATVTFASHILLAESLFTRSETDDVRRAIKVLQSAHQLAGLDIRQQ